MYKYNVVDASLLCFLYYSHPLILVFFIIPIPLPLFSLLFPSPYPYYFKRFFPFSKTVLFIFLQRNNSNKLYFQHSKVAVRVADCVCLFLNWAKVIRLKIMIIIYVFLYKIVITDQKYHCLKFGLWN